MLRPLFMQRTEDDATAMVELDYSGLLMRYLVDSLVTEGIMGAGSLRVSQRGAGANFTVDIAAGPAAITGDDVDDQGRYLVVSTDVENRTIPAPPGSGTRTHRVVAQVRDKLHNPGDWSTYDWEIVVLPDIGGGTPAIPDSAIGLARIGPIVAATPSITDSLITDDRPLATIAGANSTVAAFKNSDGSPITSNTTLAADADLKVTLLPGLIYECRWTLNYTAGTGDIKLDITGPSGFGCDLAVRGASPSISGSAGDAEQKMLNASPSAVSFGGAGISTWMGATLNGHLYSGAGGDVTIRVAQNTSTGEATRLRGKCLMICEPVPL